MRIASSSGNLLVTKWFFEVGAAEDIRAKAINGRSPMFIASSNCHILLTIFLFNVGAA
jgi:hypothetical protein